MTNAGLDTSISHRTGLEEGQRYFFTVEATNAAGLKESAYSDGITVDTTPPLLKDVLYNPQTGAAKRSHLLPSQTGSTGTTTSISDASAIVDQANASTAISSLSLCSNATQNSCYVQQSNPWRLAFSWTKAVDIESGVSSVEWCAGRGPDLCDFVSWSLVDPNAESIEYSFSRAFLPGDVVYVTIRATNGAQMFSTASSNPLLVDSSPPTIGAVVVGNTRGMKYLDANEVVKLSLIHI